MLEKKNLDYEKVVLVGIINQQQNEEKSKEYLDELEFLTYTAGGEVIARFTQRMDSANSKTFIGTGKMEELAQFIEENEIGTVVFDDELTPAQQNNIEKILRIKVLDRTTLILDIFAQRAQTSYARTQVELAQYQYLLPRLTGLWTHLERQRGGIGMRGPGETEIETDRRIVRDRIALLKKKLENIDRQMATQRGNRGALVRVALIGYTNVGKSTLMNVISKSDVFAENKLFATLDTTVRKVVIGNLLLHIVDISHPNFEEHITSVNQILTEIQSSDKPTIMVFNKIDAYKHLIIENNDLITERTTRHFTLDEWKQTWMNRMNGDAVFISATDKNNIDEFREKVYKKVREIHVTRFPYNNFLYPELPEIEIDNKNN